jgi:signal transduction histidine kinase
MTEQAENRHRRFIARTLTEFGLPALVFTLSVGIATRRWLASAVTGLAISGTISGLYLLDRKFLHGRLEKLSRDWVHLGLEMTFSLLEHVLGALAAVLACGRLFGFQVVPFAAWVPVAGMVIAFPIVHGTEMALRYFRQLKEKERAEERLRTLATQAELKALKAQIDPHFLFNTLNTIASLIHTDPTRAEATVERLAEMFRYVLTGSERGLAPLEEELAFVDGYLEIERARFGERLRVTRQIDREILHAPVPSLILQPLVENAVRHGRGVDGSIDLAISIQVYGEQVVIAISDRGPGMPPQYGGMPPQYGGMPPQYGGMPPQYGVDAGRGVGLRNVNERLRKTYGPQYGLQIRANEPHGTVVTFRIPVRAGGSQ